MRGLRQTSAVFVAIVGLCVAHIAYAYTSPGEPVGYINDFAGILSDSEEQELTATVTDFFASQGTEIALVTVPTIGEESIEEYSNLLFREWGIGGATTNNGILIVVALEERAVRIEVGYGLEGLVTDAQASGLIRDYILPSFKEGNYFKGLDDVVRGLAVLIQGSGDLPPVSATGEETFTFEGWMWFLFGGYVLASWLLSIMSRTKEWWLGGVLGLASSVVLWFFLGETIALYAALPLVLLGLSLDYVVSQGYRKAKASGVEPPWWTGGTFGGGSGSGSGGFGGRSSGGGFGGFGGGSSGGGGASGRW